MPITLLRCVLCCLVLFCGAFTTAHAAPIDNITGQSWFEDTSGRMTWPDVQNQPTTPFSGVLSRGYGTAPIWVKLRIDPAQSQTPPDKPLYLRIRPSYLDDLTLYDPLQTPAMQGPIGDLYPLAAQSAHSTRFTFSLPAGAGPRDIWVRLETSSTRMARFEVFNTQALAVSNGVLDMGGSFYLGLLGLFVLWGVIQFVLRPEPLMLCFVLHQVTALLFGSNTLGYTRLLLDDVVSPAIISTLTSGIGIFASGVAVLFAHFLLNEISHSRWRTRLIGLILAVFAALIGLLLSGRVMDALEGNMVLILVVPTLLLIMALASRSSPDPRSEGKLPKPWVVGYFVLTLVFTLFAAAPSLGLINAPELSLYIVLFYSLTSGLLMITMLVYRAHLHLLYQQAQAAKALISEQRAEQEKAHRLDRERLLAMMGHELKTPLATLRMLLGNQTIPEALSRRMDASIQDMTGVVDRVVQTGRLDDQATIVRLETCALGSVLSLALRDLPDNARVVIEPKGQGADTLETDPDLLGIVLRNLLDNALKYSPPESTVTVRHVSDAQSGDWRIEVENLPGRAGWPDAVHVFDKYYRSPQASYRAGSGLGLFIVQELAHMIGAHIDYAPDAQYVRFVLHAAGTTAGLGVYREKAGDRQAEARGQTEGLRQTQARGQMEGLRQTEARGQMEGLRQTEAHGQTQAYRQTGEGYTG